MLKCEPKVVEEARLDYASLVSKTIMYRRTARYYYNSLASKVVVVISSSSSADITGECKFTPGTIQNVVIGKAVALRRALGLVVLSKYYNALKQGVLDNKEEKDGINMTVTKGAVLNQGLVAEAIEDWETIKNRVEGVGHTIRYMADPSMLNVKVNITRKHSESQGTAVCTPDDIFNTPIGRIIAAYRALGQDVPRKYLSATIRPIVPAAPIVVAKVTEVKKEEVLTMTTDIKGDFNYVAKAVLDLRKYISATFAIPEQTPLFDVPATYTLANLVGTVSLAKLKQTLVSLRNYVKTAAAEAMRVKHVLDTVEVLIDPKEVRAISANLYKSEVAVSVVHLRHYISAILGVPADVPICGVTDKDIVQLTRTTDKTDLTVILIKLRRYILAMAAVKK